jgi:hypothetical protein
MPDVGMWPSGLGIPSIHLTERGMNEALNPLAIGVAAIAAFFLSFIWYSVFADALNAARSAGAAAAAEKQPPPWKIAIELSRCAVLAFVLAWTLARIGTVGWADAALVGLMLWLGLSAVQWTGAMLWEAVPFRMAAIHAGDWLAKILLITIITGVWR